MRGLPWPGVVFAVQAAGIGQGFGTNVVEVKIFQAGFFTTRCQMLSNPLVVCGLPVRVLNKCMLMTDSISPDDGRLAASIRAPFFSALA